MKTQQPGRRDISILMSPAMVRATLREIEQPGTGKTQTRRVLDLWCDEPPALVHDGQIIAYDDGDREYRWPRTKAVGDRLYVREAWRTAEHLDKFAPKVLPVDSPVFFEADAGGDVVGATGKFRQGIHMPRWASRITLIVTDVRVQRVQEISGEDAEAEGITIGGPDVAVYQREAERNHEAARRWNAYRIRQFRDLWDSLNDKPSRPGCAWRDNPWVAAYTFLPVLGNIDQVRA